MRTEGWIFDLYHQKGQMIIWLKTANDSCVKLVDKWRPRIYIAGETRDLLKLACKDWAENTRLVWKYERPGDRGKSRVLEIAVENETDASALAETIERLGHYSRFRLYNVDVPAAQMYLYEKDLFPLAKVKAEINCDKIQWSLKDSRESVDYVLPNLRTITFDITTAATGKIRSSGDELESAVIKIDDRDSLTIDSGSEAEKLTGIVDAFHAIDPDIINTKGGDSFVFPYLARRAQRHNILHDFILGRENSPLKVYSIQGHSYFSYGKILYRETAIRLPGRLHLDTENAYISNDCDTAGLFEVSRTCIMPVQRTSRATIGTSMTSLQLYHATRQDILIPWNKNQAEDLKRSEELVTVDRGGYIYEPQTGIHDNVGELDFSSLYPMLMLKRNLSGETVGCACCPDSTQRVPEIGTNICQRWQGIVPRSLEILLKKRAFYKQQKENAASSSREIQKRSDALKWILVCS